MSGLPRRAKVTPYEHRGKAFFRLSELGSLGIEGLLSALAQESDPGLRKAAIIALLRATGAQSVSDLHEVLGERGACRPTSEEVVELLKWRLPY